MDNKHKVNSEGLDQPATGELSEGLLEWSAPQLVDLSVLNTMGGSDRLNDESQTVLGTRGYF